MPMGGSECRETTGVEVAWRLCGAPVVEPPARPRGEEGRHRCGRRRRRQASCTAGMAETPGLSASVEVE